MNFNSIFNRVIQVLRFDSSVFREIAADPAAMLGGWVVVVLAILLSVIGLGGHQGFGFADLLMGLILQILLFVVFAFFARR